MQAIANQKMSSRIIKSLTGLIQDVHDRRGGVYAISLQSDLYEQLREHNKNNPQGPDEVFGVKIYDLGNSTTGLKVNPDMVVFATDISFEAYRYILSQLDHEKGLSFQQRYLMAWSYLESEGFVVDGHVERYNIDAIPDEAWTFTKV